MPRFSKRHAKNGSRTADDHFTLASIGFFLVFKISAARLADN
jgi:hypothetical protein